MSLLFDDTGPRDSNRKRGGQRGHKNRRKPHKHRHHNHGKQERKHQEKRRKLHNKRKRPSPDEAADIVLQQTGVFLNILKTIYTEEIVRQIVVSTMTLLLLKYTNAELPGIQQVKEEVLPVVELYKLPESANADSAQDATVTQATLSNIAEQFAIAIVGAFGSIFVGLSWVNE